MLKPSLVVLSMGVLLSGCSTRAPEPNVSPVTSPLAAVTRAAPAATQAAAPQASEPEVAYSYTPVGKHDPFRDPRDTACCLPPPPLACNQPLCRYSLDELKLSGVISGMANPVAVIEGPQGKSYQVSRGTQVGRNGGVVKRVLRDAIVVAEVAPDGQGLVREYETVLRVQPDLPLSLGELSE
jgi:type IV pilus assembly protein PilP